MGGFFNGKRGFLRFGDRNWTLSSMSMHATVASPSLAENGIYGLVRRSRTQAAGEARQCGVFGRSVAGVAGGQPSPRRSERN